MDKVRVAADEMLQVFNQSSVLIQSNETKTVFYYSGIYRDGMSHP